VRLSFNRDHNLDAKAHSKFGIRIFSRSGPVAYHRRGSRPRGHGLARGNLLGRSIDGAVGGQQGAFEAHCICMLLSCWANCSNEPCPYFINARWCPGVTCHWPLVAQQLSMSVFLFLPCSSFFLSSHKTTSGLGRRTEASARRTAEEILLAVCLRCGPRWPVEWQRPKMADPSADLADSTAWPWAAVLAEEKKRKRIYEPTRAPKTIGRRNFRRRDGRSSDQKTSHIGTLASGWAGGWLIRGELKTAHAGLSASEHIN